jgi:hypothetical protein
MRRPAGARARRAFVALATLLLAASGALAATRVLAITTASAHPATAFKTFDGNPAKTFDLDGDGDLEVLAQNDNDVLYVFDGATGRILAELKSTYPAGWGARTFNGPEAYRDGGVTHVVQENSAAVVTSWRLDAAASNATHLAFAKEWERRLNDCFSGAGADSKPVLADLDRDGRPEILGGTEESGVYALRADGSLYWKKCISGGNGEPRAVDLDLDGWLDVVHASDNGIVTAMRGRCSATAPCSPATMWSYSILAHFNLGSASVPVGAGFGQLDGAGGPDVVVGARDSHNATDWGQDHALLLALSSTGALLWGRQDSVGNPLTYTHPIVADGDGDGANEVYWGDWNTIGHKPPWNEADSWKTTGPAHFYRYDGQGNLVWRQSLATFWSNKDLALADADGDGRQEVLATGPNAQGHEGIWLLDSATGVKESFIDAYPWMVTRGPVLDDLSGTGRMQMVLEVGPQATTEGAAVHVYDLGVPFNAVWPHLPSSPAVPPVTTSTSTGPPPAAFDATFTIKAPNEWWQELSVTAPGHTIASADVRVNGDVWQPMSKASWGAWTSSYRAVAGSTVEFLVHDAAGASSQSLPFTWMDGTLSKGSTTGSTSTSSSATSTSATSTSTTTTTTTTSTTTTTTTGTNSTSASTSTSATGTSTAPGFSATFDVPSGVNEWWVEVKVTSAQAVVKVEASLNGGAWQDLPKTSWGTWAKSIHAPAGTQVVFRATSGAGATALSPTFSWLGGSTTTTSTTTTTTSTTSATGTSTTGTASPFTATFTPHAVGNDWWVETEAAGNHPIAKVEANLNGGAWQDLPKTSWGTWAKSINAPNGTQITFRATDGAGATATSAAITWT